jgi:hypothetical protein
VEDHEGAQESERNKGGGGVAMCVSCLIGIN